MNHFTLGAPESTPSVHRAFVYNAALPGLGLFYLGQRVVGTLAIIAIVLVTVWFVSAFAVMTFGFTGWLSSNLSGRHSPSAFSISAISLALPAGIFYLLWSLTLFSGLLRGRALQNKLGDVQTSPYWAMGMSALCPGAGQVYAGYARLGVALFVAYLGGTVLSLPSLSHLGTELVTSMGEQNLLLGDIQALESLAHDLSLRLDFGFGRVAMQVIWGLSVALGAALLGRGDSRASTQVRQKNSGLDDADGGALARTGWRLLVVVIASYLLPGAVQLAQARHIRGWILCATELGLLLFGASLFAFGALNTAGLDVINSLRSYLVLIALVEIAGNWLWRLSRSVASKRV